MTKEKIALVNDKDEVIGEIFILEAHKKGLLHREAYTYLINSKKQVLLQKRKDRSIWDTSSAGHFSIKEDYLDGAQREFEEELGIKLEKEDFIEIGSERRNSGRDERINNRFVKIFLVKKDIPINRFKLEEKEVLEVRYFNKEELINLLNSGNTTQTLIDLIPKYILPLLEKK
jgi:isopentenyldiphosphate isomerase